MTIDLAAIRDRTAAATEGPWEARDLADAQYNSADGRGWWWVWKAGCPHYAGVAEMAAGFLSEDGVKLTGCSVAEAQITDNDRGAVEQADAEFIAHARQDVPALLNAVESARRFAVQFEAENAHMRAVIGEISALVAGMRMPCWCITYKHTAVDALVCEACRLRGLLTDLTEMP